MAIHIPNALEYQGILTGGQPTADQYEQAKEAGYTTIVNLRGLGEPGVAQAQQAVEALGMTYVAIPISGGHDLSRDNAEKLAEAIDASEGKVMVHCKSGNRVGALFALKARWLDGAELDDAIEIGRKTGLTSSEPAVRQLAEED